MAHAFVELNKEAHGRICASGLNTLLQHNRNNIISKQEREIRTLKRKLARERTTLNTYKISRRTIMEERDVLCDRLADARFVMRENFDAVRGYMHKASQAEGWTPFHESDHWKDAFDSLHEVFNIVTNNGEDDSEGNSEASD